MTTKNVPRRWERGAICQVSDCQKKHHSRGYCSRHYEILIYRAKADAHVWDWRISQNQSEFWALVRKNANEKGCWEWQGQMTKGYGKQMMFGRRWFAHRLSWRLAHGYEPELSILHDCDNKRCVNPDHLHEGTQADNVREALDRGLLPVGEKSPAAKLTDDLVRSIRRRIDAGERMRVIAREIGVDHSQISRAYRRERWTHVQ